MAVNGSGPADNDHRYELNQIEAEVSKVADYFQDHPGSMPDDDYEEAVEHLARHALGRLEQFIAERWGS